MSIRRAVEYHLKWCIEEEIKQDFPDFEVVESLRQEERPLPVVLITAGEAEPMLGDQPDSLGNYSVSVSALVLSNVHKDTVDNHSEVAHRIRRKMSEVFSRKASRVMGLYLYEIEQGGIGEDNDGHQMGTGINFRVLCNYQPEFTG